MNWAGVWLTVALAAVAWLTAPGGLVLLVGAAWLWRRC